MSTTPSPKGRSLELYFIDGRPDGMLTAEVFNWTGHVLMAPRTMIKTALARNEAEHTGVYLLLGERDGEPLAYIGEGENIGQRIGLHVVKMDWWNSAVMITTGANNLNKAHVKYLEARLVEIAKRISRIQLANGNTPPRPSLSEAGQSNMEAFLEYVLMVLPAIGVDAFVERSRPDPQTKEEDAAPAAPVFEMVNRKHDLHATARLVNSDFIVEAGSSARLKWEGRGTEDSRGARLHDELRKVGILQPDGQRCKFVKSYAFSSPSAAANRRTWKTCKRNH